MLRTKIEKYSIPWHKHSELLISCLDIDSTERADQMRRAVRRCIIFNTRAEIVGDRVITVAQRVFLGGFGALVFFGGYLVFGVLPQVSMVAPTDPRFIFNPGGEVVFLVAMILGFRLFKRAKILLTTLTVLTITVGYLYLATTLEFHLSSLFDSTARLNTNDLYIWSSIWWMLTFMALFLASSQAAIVFTRTYFRRVTVEYSLAIAVAKLLQSLAIAVHARDSKERRETFHIPGYLAHAADCIGNGLRQGLHSLDLSVNESEVISRRMNGAAEVLKSYRIWVMLPREDTYDLLVEKLASFCNTLLFSNFDSLPEPEYSSHQKVNKATLVRSVTRTALVALLPALLLGTFEAVGLVLPSPARETSILISFVWAIVTILTAIDPLFKDRVSATSEIFSLIKGKKA